TGLDHGGVEAVHAPARRGRVARLDATGIEFLLDRGSVDVQRATGNTDLGELDQGSAGAQSLAQPQLPPVEAARGEILAQRPITDRVTTRDQFVHGLGGDQQQGLSWAAMNLRMRAEIAFDSERGNEAFRDGPFREPAAGDADMDYVTSHV